MLWWLYEMLVDTPNNPNPWEKMELHLKYLDFFLNWENLTSI